MSSFIKTHDFQTRLEEIFNSLSHGVGALLGIAALVILTTKASLYGTTLMVVSSAIYGASLVIMYTSSTLYHILEHPVSKKTLKIIDHSSIYLLIAGSYTPFTLVAMGGGWGWSLFGVIWGLAFSGIIFKLFFTGKLDTLSVSIYILMGWLVVIAIKPLINDIPLGGLVWLGLGGLSYTFGVIFYVYDGKYHFSHFIWHLFVLGGSICQFIAILFYIIK